MASDPRRPMVCGKGAVSHTPRKPRFRRAVQCGTLMCRVFAPKSRFWLVLGRKSQRAWLEAWTSERAWSPISVAVTARVLRLSHGYTTPTDVRGHLAPATMVSVVTVFGPNPWNHSERWRSVGIHGNPWGIRGKPLHGQPRASS